MGAFCTNFHVFITTTLNFLPRQSFRTRKPKDRQSNYTKSHCEMPQWLNFCSLNSFCFPNKISWERNIVFSLGFIRSVIRDFKNLNCGFEKKKFWNVKKKVCLTFFGVKILAALGAQLHTTCPPLTKTGPRSGTVGIC